MGRAPCCDEPDLKKGPWTPEEDQKLLHHIKEHGHGSWRTLPKLAALNRCGKSCRLRWANYLRPDIKRGKFTEDEERIIINLHAVLGNKWSRIAGHLPGRTDNEIKNYWNTYLRKKLLQMGIDPSTHKPRTDINHLINISHLLGLSNLSSSMNLIWGNPLATQSADVTQVAKLQLLHNLLQSMNPSLLLNSVNPNPNLNPSLDLLANHSSLNNNPLIPGLVSRTNTDHLLIGLLQAQYANHGLFNPQQPSPQPNTKSEITGTDDGIMNGLDHLEFFAVNNNDNSLSSSLVDHLAVRNNFINTSREDDPANYVLPPLGSAASSTTCSPSKQMEGTSCNPTHQDSTQSPSSSSVFEDWEKLLDDDTSGTYWKEILDFSLASTSSPLPDVSW